jgi:DNA-binding LacI/PurR family transcriptional regulator
MAEPFQAESVAAQVARHLRAEIVAGKWSAWIPAERELCERLRVSRGTVRAALAILKRERLIETHHGIGSAPRGVAANGNQPEHPALPVCVLMPEPLNLLRPYVTIWIDLLRGLLMDAGRGLQLCTGQDYFQPRGARHLERLVAQHPASCWVLAHSNERVQRWFETAGVPCVVLGLPHAEITLPSVALDIRAVCRHAAGEFLRLGHRRLGLVSTAHPSPGATQAAQGFIETVRAHGGDAIVEKLDVAVDDVDGACRQVRRALGGRRQLTGFMVINPMLYAAVQSTVQGMGLRVPQDVSLMTTYGDPFLNFVRPTAARYTHTPPAFARRLLRSILRVVSGDPQARRQETITPDFVPGESLAAVRPAERTTRE